MNKQLWIHGTTSYFCSEFNARPDTISVISEAVFTANHMTDTDRQNKTVQENTQTKYNSNTQTTQNTAKRKTTLVQSPLTTLNQQKMGLFYNTPEPTLEPKKNWKA